MCSKPGIIITSEGSSALKRHNYWQNKITNIPRSLCSRLLVYMWECIPLQSSFSSRVQFLFQNSFLSVSEIYSCNIKKKKKLQGLGDFSTSWKILEYHKESVMWRRWRGEKMALAYNKGDTWRNIHSGGFISGGRVIDIHCRSWTNQRF